MNSKDLQIAQTIRKQLTTLGLLKVASWGAHGWAIAESGLLFKVNGNHLKGRVKITLTPMDEYEIEFFKAGEPKAYKKLEGIYFDEMVDIIDQEVEYIPAYGNN